MSFYQTYKIFRLETHSIRKYIAFFSEKSKAVKMVFFLSSLKNRIEYVLAIASIFQSLCSSASMIKLLHWGICIHLSIRHLNLHSFCCFYFDCFFLNSSPNLQSFHFQQTQKNKFKFFSTELKSNHKFMYCIHFINTIKINIILFKI